MYRLTVVAGPTRGKHHNIEDGQVNIGRQSSNQIALPSGKVSKLHCVLEVSGDSIVVLDQNSSNGTFVNGILAKRRKIKPGDRISIGEYIFELNIRPSKVALVELNQNLRMEQIGGGGALGGVLPGNLNSSLGSSQEDMMVPQGPPADFKGRVVWFFEKKIMPILYELNTKHEWRVICMGLFGIFVLFNLLLSVYPIIQSDQGTLIKEIQRRAVFLAEQIVDQNNSFIAAGAETKTTLGIVEKGVGVKSAFLIDLDLRIIAPGSKLNQYLSGGPEGLFAVKMRDLYRKGKEDYAVRYDEDSALAMAAVPVLVLSAAQGKNVVVGMAIVAIDTQLSNPDAGETGLVYSKTFIFTAALAGLIFLLIYKLTLNPFEVLNEDLDKALKGNLSEVSRLFKFSEIESLLDLINSAIQRFSSGGGSSGGLGDAMASNATDEYLYPMQMIGKIVKFGFVVLDSEKHLLYFNSVFEEISGIRSDSSLGQALSTVARDQALGSFVEDLLDRTQTGTDGLTEDFDFSGVAFKMHAAAFGMSGARAKCFILAAIKAEE